MDRFIPAIIAVGIVAFVGLGTMGLMAVVEEQKREAERWAVFAEEHACKIIHTERSRTIPHTFYDFNLKTIRTTYTYISGWDLWQCADGTTHKR